MYLDIKCKRYIINDLHIYFDYLYGFSSGIFPTHYLLLCHQMIRLFISRDLTGFFDKNNMFLQFTFQNLRVNQFQINKTIDKIHQLESFCFVKTCVSNRRLFKNTVSSSDYKPTPWNGRMMTKKRIRRDCGLI